MNVMALVLLAVMTSAMAAPQDVDWMRIEPKDDIKTSFYPYDEAWTAYKREYGKEYQSIDEEEMHFNIFLDNVREIEKHNADYVKGMESYYMGINLFTDMTDEEKKSRGCLLWNEKSERSSINTTFLAPNNLDLPDEVDWRKKGYVTSVKNQGRCGSCWAFSTTGTLEGQHFRKTGRLVSLSEQQLVDCSKRNLGCNGGLPSTALDYIKETGGLEGELDYPYQGKQADRCHFEASKVKATVTGAARVTEGDERALQAAVASVGPISVGVNAKPLQRYKGGVLDDPACGKVLDHAILVVGYGTQNGKDYWLIKNSWGTNWGLAGYAMMSRNKNNQCGIASNAVYPLV